MKYIEEILPCLITMLDFNDKQIKADTCWAFSYITDGPNERIQYVLDVSNKMYYTQCTVKLRPNFQKIAQLNCTTNENRN